MSQRLDKSWLVFDSVETFEHDRCVDLFSRPDGTFGFEEFRRDIKDRGAWTPIAYYSDQSYARAGDALEEAKRAVPWLADALNRRVRRKPRYELRRPASEADWQAFHDIREAVLWTARGKAGYNRRHEDDYEVPANQPLLFKADGVALGCLRLDGRNDGTGVVRLVAISEAAQGRGHGRAMSAAWEDVARARGMHALLVNAAPEAIGYYEKLGWQRHVWDQAELEGIAADCIQMRRPL